MSLAMRVELEESAFYSFKDGWRKLGLRLNAQGFLEEFELRLKRSRESNAFFWRLIDGSKMERKDGSYYYEDKFSAWPILFEINETEKRLIGVFFLEGFGKVNVLSHAVWRFLQRMSQAGIILEEKNARQALMRSFFRSLPIASPFGLNGDREKKYPNSKFFIDLTLRPASFVHIVEMQDAKLPLLKTCYPYSGGGKSTRKRLKFRDRRAAEKRKFYRLFERARQMETEEEFYE